jgi:serine/threonine-protein kinase
MTATNIAGVRQGEVLAGKYRVERVLGPPARTVARVPVTRRRRIVPAAALLVSVVLAASPGRAEGQSGAAAEVLFDEGKALMNAGKASEACPKFEESQRLDPASGTLINLALCYERSGRTASAWSTYRDAATAARLSGNVERERGARERASALMPKVSKLTIALSPEARVDGLIVTRDGVEVGPAQYGTPLPIDEGTHELTAKAPGYRTWRAQVVVPANGATASVMVPRLVPAPNLEIAGAAATQVTPSGASTQAPATAHETLAAPTKSSGLGAQRTMALVAGAVGVTGIAVGSAFGLKAISKKNEADKTCDGGVCTSPDGASAGNDAHAAGNISTVGLIIGAVGLVGGTVLWLTAPSGHATGVGVAPNGVVVRSAF